MPHPRKAYRCSSGSMQIWPSITCTRHTRIGSKQGGAVGAPVRRSKRPLVERAFDLAADDAALGQEARPVGALVGGDEILVAALEHRKGEAVALHSARHVLGYLRRGAERGELRVAHPLAARAVCRWAATPRSIYRRSGPSA